MSNTTFALSLCLAGCASAIAMPDLVAPRPVAPSVGVAAISATDLAFARAVGLPGLEQMLQKYDGLPHGPARDELGARIDKVAAQKYATVSRLFWFTDIEAAKAEAAKTHKPILALRMLGRLDEEMSCANSRFFRTTLYANKDLSAYLKQHFVLYWSSERDVPKVTIDFGDGRRIESTTTGNSAHYILDEKGDVLDVIPGLYTPQAFRAELETSLAHAKNVADAPARLRTATIISYHQQKVEQIRNVSSHLKVFAMQGKRMSHEEAMERAQRATISKAFVEVPQLRQITAAELTSLDEDETATWASFADQLWPVMHEALAPRGSYTQIPSNASLAVFDAQSIGLVRRLHGEAPAQDIARMLSRLAQHAKADSALNQLRLRAEIAVILSNGHTDFATINDQIYAKVFHTPKSDPWLGLRSRLDFTGLPNDGITMPAKAAQR